TMSMHSNEVGPSQSVPLIAYDLITTDDIKKHEWLENTVLMIVPCHNPDGMDMVINHYNKYKDTKYEGSSLPGIYHKYVGHDNNRDFITLTQSDTRAIAAIYNKDWFPQVMIEKHQMWSNGTRYFVPPMHDPIAVNVDEEVWNWTWVFGSNMSKDMTKQGLAGISQHYLFDDYWPGSTETCLWKGVIGMLTEAAAVQHAKPVFIEKNEIEVIGKGMSEYKKSINMPLVWEGGWWRLSDIVDYEIASTYSIMKTSSMNREELLKFRNNLSVKEVNKGKTIPPYYYVLPKVQKDESELMTLLELLDEHGVEIFYSEINMEIEDHIVKQGDYIIPLAQPFRAFIKEVMEKQEFPERHYTPDGKLIKPYDITSWSLPLHRGIKSVELSTYSDKLNSSLKKVTIPVNVEIQIPVEYRAIIFNVSNNQSFEIAFKALNNGLKVYRTQTDKIINNKKIKKGSFVLLRNSKVEYFINDSIERLLFQPMFIKDINKQELKELSMPKIGLIETYFHDMDAGWTRFVLDEYNINYTVLRPEELQKPEKLTEIDLLIFPDMDKDVLMEGKYKEGESYFISKYPPEYTKGMGKEGLNNVLKYINNGGNIISWRRSSDLFMGTLKITEEEKTTEEFQLPIKNISKELKKKKLYCPGSLLSVDIIKDHPVCYGLSDEIDVFSRGEPVFTTSVPMFDMDRRVIGVFPENNVLSSGYIENEELIENKSAIVWIKKGKG
ncbi:M14 family zinc carboxypeptidase, partial [Bacteroidota bacterium]